jgi:hypothetical protein
MVSKFNLVFTDMDLLKQIIIYTKEPRQILKRRLELDKEAEQFIHICLKFYKMNEEEYSYIYNDLHTAIARSISNRNVRCGKLNETTNPIDWKLIKNKICNGYTFEKKHITKWIKEYYKYLDDERLEDIRHFDGRDLFNNNMSFCLECKEYKINTIYDDITEIGKFDCSWYVCVDCMYKEMNKKKWISK